MDKIINIPAWYYQHFDADLSLEIPGEGYGGWKKAENLSFSLSHSALVVMHTWNCYEPEDFPGWWRVVEYLPRAKEILQQYFPPMLALARKIKLPIIHVVWGGNYYQDLTEHKYSVNLAGQEEVLPQVRKDVVREGLDAFRESFVFPGDHNQSDVARSRIARDFAPEAKPLPGEIIVSSSKQLFMHCHELGINHLLYSGFAINWCLLMSPGGMLEMQKYGLLCSVIKEMTTAVENKESARNELAKQLALWKVALQFGFVYEYEDLRSALGKLVNRD